MSRIAGAGGWSALLAASLTLASLGSLAGCRGTGESKVNLPWSRGADTPAVAPAPEAGDPFLPPVPSGLSQTRRADDAAIRTAQREDVRTSFSAVRLGSPSPASSVE